MVPPVKGDATSSPAIGSSEDASDPFPAGTARLDRAPDFVRNAQWLNFQWIPAMAKYDPLEAHLARRSDEEFELSFEEVERIVGDALPMSASRPQWWANETNPDSSHVQSRSWRSAGYDAFLLPHGRVLFRRRSS